MEKTQGETTRVALYARVSTEEQREGNTIESQIAELEKFVETNGWVVQGRYIDEGWSGALLARPELDRLRDDAGRDVFDVVLVNDVDRLARDVAHLGVIKRDLERKKIRLVFRKLPASSDPMNNLMVNILGSFAEFEREMIADRTRRGMRHKVEVQKQYAGCTAPYGYKYIRKDLNDGVGILKINPDEARVVRDMFKWVAEEGLSVQKVADRLTRLKIPTRKGRAVWQCATAYRILRNETYVGIWAYGKGEVFDSTISRDPKAYRRKRTSRRPKPRSEWARIPLPEEFKLISRKLWETVQKQIDSNPRFSPRNTKIHYLLQGLLKCEFCSSRLTGTYSRDRRYGRTYTYYACSRKCGKLKWIRRGDLDAVVWNQFKSALLNPADLKSRVTRALERIAKEGQTIQHRQTDISLKEIESQESAIFRQYQNGQVTSQQLGLELNRLGRARLQILSIKPQELTTNTVSVNESIDKYCDRVKARLQKPTFAVKQQILRHLVNAIPTNNEFVRIQGALPAPITNSFGQHYHTDALPHRPKQILNNEVDSQKLKFEIRAKLPSLQRRWFKKPEGVKFVDKTEENYVPEEGKSLAVATILQYPLTA